MNMNLKGIMQTLGAQPGQVVSNPYVRAFAPQPSVKEEVVNEEDHEVSMAQNQLDSIIKNATELKGKIGEMEKNIPGWIQDHITNSENYIEQANTGYHELEESLNEEFKHIISVETPTQVVSKPIAAQIEKLARQGVRSKEIGLKMGFVGNQKVATDAFQKLKNQIYFKLNKSEAVNEARLTDIVNSIVETPVIGKMIRTEAKKYDVGAGFMGNGLTIWNRAEEEHGDYRIIAHIDSYGKISIRDKQIPSNIMNMIKDWAEAIKKGDK